MGLLISCCKGTEEELITPDSETRRRQLAAAAERRQKDNETRGIKDPESIRIRQKKADELDRLEKAKAVEGPGEPALRWQMN